MLDLTAARRDGEEELGYDQMDWAEQCLLVEHHVLP